MTATNLTDNLQGIPHTFTPTNLSDRTLVLFTRVPVAGKSKTRLQSALTPQQCADVQMAMICDTMEELSNLDCDIVVSYAPDHEDQENAEELLARFQQKLNDCHRNVKHPLRFMRQEGETLGDRMDNAFAQAFRMGAKHCLLMGSDIPGVRTSELNKLFFKLEHRDIVLCPSQDGGYWLVGLNERFQALFESKRFGRDTVLAEAIRTCSECGKSLAFGPKKTDIDTPRQLQHYSVQLSNGTHECRHFAALLRELDLPYLANGSLANNTVHSIENDRKENVWNDSLTQANQAP